MIIINSNVKEWFGKELFSLQGPKIPKGSVRIGGLHEFVAEFSYDNVHETKLVSEPKPGFFSTDFGSVGIEFADGSWVVARAKHSTEVSNLLKRLVKKSSPKPF